MFMDTLSINGTSPIRSSVDISDKLPEDVLKYIKERGLYYGAK